MPVRKHRDCEYLVCVFIHELHAHAALHMCRLDYVKECGENTRLSGSLHAMEI